jgi:hypothetical protein
MSSNQTLPTLCVFLNLNASPLELDARDHHVLELEVTIPTAATWATIPIVATWDTIPMEATIRTEATTLMVATILMEVTI